MKINFSTRNLRYFLHRAIRIKTTRLEGILVTCDETIINRSLARAIIRGSYEKAERQFAKNAIRAGDRILEIGAGIGVVGILCQRHAKSGKVVSYETNPHLRDIIFHNYMLNGMTPDITMKAVSVAGGPITFFRSTNIISSSVHDRSIASEQMVVDSTPINEAIQNSRAQVIVMDVEGAEAELLPAANLRDVREIIVETHPHVVGEAAIDAMIKTIVKRGFSRTSKQGKVEWFSRVTKADPV